MSSTKKGFVLYFDMYPALMSLNLEQRGLLFTALFRYAAQESEELGSAAAMLEQFPDMDAETRMAFRFMGQAIFRDTEKWRQKQERYAQAARERARRLREEAEEELPL